MPGDINAAYFDSRFPIDKLVRPPESATFQMAAPAAPFYNDSDNLQTFTLPNPYGKRCLVRYVWNVDGVNDNAPDTILRYAFTVDATAIGGGVSSPNEGIKAACAMGVSDSLLFFQLLNAWHSNVTYTLGNDVFTGFAQTFRITYALYEIN